MSDLGYRRRYTRSGIQDIGIRQDGIQTTTYSSGIQDNYGYMTTTIQEARLRQVGLQKRDTEAGYNKSGLQKRRYSLEMTLGYRLGTRELGHRSVVDLGGIQKRDYRHCRYRLRQVNYDKTTTTRHLRQDNYDKTTTTRQLRQDNYDKTTTTRQLREDNYDKTTTLR